MRLIARFMNKEQVSALVDSLRNAGFDRKDMIISDLWEEQKWENFEDAAKEVAFIKMERDGLGEVETFGDGIPEMRGKEGIIVAVEMPKHESDRVRTIMRQSGAVEIVQD
ncbi:hypothetical protein H1S01_08820 [Heliobacterium chlorum]|uniref:Uncharacterized protein n=1 Tax=Heliobacterium chlorum TaxID=2698 RepID=A0ABR7T3C3_HELCL|nr:hypothetical protein [Heliobacterium chlorum]MBC9784612.1 hypothetical protein [Heliobacterium chlorum]